MYCKALVCLENCISFLPYNYLSLQRLTTFAEGVTWITVYCEAYTHHSKKEIQNRKDQRKERSTSRWSALSSLKLQTFLYRSGTYVIMLIHLSGAGSTCQSRFDLWPVPRPIFFRCNEYSYTPGRWKPGQIQSAQTT